MEYDFFHRWRKDNPQSLTVSVGGEECTVYTPQPFRYFCAIAQKNDDGAVAFVIAVRFSKKWSHLLVGKLKPTIEEALISALADES